MPHPRHTMRRRPAQAPFQNLSLRLKFGNKPEEADHYDNNWNRPALAQVTPLELAVTVPRNWRSLRGPPGSALMLQVLALMLWVLALLALML